MDGLRVPIFSKYGDERKLRDFFDDYFYENFKEHEIEIQVFPEILPGEIEKGRVVIAVFDPQVLPSYLDGRNTRNWTQRERMLYCGLGHKIDLSKTNCDNKGILWMDYNGEFEDETFVGMEQAEGKLTIKLDSKKPEIEGRITRLEGKI